MFSLEFGGDDGEAKEKDSKRNPELPSHSLVLKRVKFDMMEVLYNTRI